jgi:hypothetical protein
MPRSQNANGGIRETTAVLLGLASLLGIVMTALGISYSIVSNGPANQHPSLSGEIVGGVLISFGSAIVGAVVSTFVTRQTGQDLLEDIRSVIANSLECKFTSTEDTLAPIRHDWFHYHVTGVQNHYIWRHDIYRFRHSASVASLVANIVVKDDSPGMRHQYRLEAGVRGTRLIIIQTRIDGNELPVIQVYPDMAESFRSTHCGIILNQDWDGHNIISKSILSRTRLIAGLEEGSVDAAHFATLDRIWSEGFEQGCIMFPPPVAN